MTEFSCLKHLRELCANDNSITSLEGITQLDGLIKVSVRGNKISSLSLDKAKWSRLEVLDVADNRVNWIHGLETLTSVQELTLGKYSASAFDFGLTADDNYISDLLPSRPMTSMRSIRASGNALTSIDLSLFPKLRTLYADRNDLLTLDRTSSSSRIENLSLRNQRRHGLRISAKELQSVKRLYLSGNPLSDSFFPSQPLYALVYIEAAACNLRALPRDMARTMPSLKVLNINYNYLENLDGLAGLKSLRKISVVGNRLGGSGGKAVMRGLKDISTLEEVDLR